MSPVRTRTRSLSRRVSLRRPDGRDQARQLPRVHHQESRNCESDHFRCSSLFAFDPAATQAHPRSLSTKALWDTGANRSVITKKTAGELGLAPTGAREVFHAAGSSVRQSYVVNLFLPNQVTMAGILVTECDNLAGNFGVIIGMDIICAGDFAISNHGGTTTMSFRIPSREEIDFLKS